MKSKKLLTITLTSLLIGSCLVLPALADSADAPSGGNVATYEISANVKRIDEYAFANSTSLVSVKIPDCNCHRGLRLLGLHEPERDHDSQQRDRDWRARIRWMHGAGKVAGAGECDKSQRLHVL